MIGKLTFLVKSIVISFQVMDVGKIDTMESKTSLVDLNSSLTSVFFGENSNFGRGRRSRKAGAFSMLCNKMAS